jgi:hypothetical protein
MREIASPTVEGVIEVEFSPAIIVVSDQERSYYVPILSCDDANPPSLPRAGLPPNHDLDVLVDRRQQVHQAFDGEPLQLVMTKPGTAIASQNRSPPSVISRVV